jgi:cytochrome c oxidase subunit 4
MTTAETHTNDHSDDHEHHEDFTHTPRFYWIVGAILAVITAIEVGVTLIQIPHPILVPILLVLSIIKGAGVVMFFMHLRGDAKGYQFMFVVPFLLAAVFVLFFLLLFSEHVGIAG